MDPANARRLTIHLVRSIFLRATVADSVARTAKKVALEDERVMSELEKTGDRLSDAIDATESLTEELRGAAGRAGTRQSTPCRGPWTGPRRS